VDSHRAHLDALLTPSSTYMDLNIGAALWLAASAEGWMHQEDDACSQQKPHARRTVGEAGPPASDSGVTKLSPPMPTRTQADGGSGETTSPPDDHVWYRSEARVLLVGAGADEQCGTT